MPYRAWCVRMAQWVLQYHTDSSRFKSTLDVLLLATAEKEEYFKLNWGFLLLLYIALCLQLSLFLSAPYWIVAKYYLLFSMKRVAKRTAEKPLKPEFLEHQPSYIIS